MNDFVLEIAASPAASIVVKASLVTGVGLAAAWFVRGKRAALRHAILAATFGMLLALPVAIVVTPRLAIAIPARSNTPVAPVALVAHATEPASTLAVDDAKPAPQQSANMRLATFLELAWIAGAVLFLIPMLAGLWQIRTLRRSAIPWTPPCGVGRVEVLLHEDIPGPMTCGVVHPAIVLPREATRWSAVDLNRAMVHELEHVRRFDWLTRCAARAVCAVYWFHPLVWIAWRWLTLDAERSCDDAVLRQSEPTAYADQLVGLAKRMSAGHTPQVLAMASRADLATRVGAVLDQKQLRGRLGGRAAAVACAAAGVFLMAVSPITMVEAQQPPVIMAAVAAPLAPALVAIAPTPKKIKRALSTMAITAAPQSAPQPAAAPNPIAPSIQFATSTWLVGPAVIVLDRDGNSVEGLTARDFTVSEDDVIQRISVFEFQRPSPADGKSYYILGYYASNQTLDPAYRRFKITVNSDKVAKIDYRQGYYALKATDPSRAPMSEVSGDLTGIVPPRLRLKFEAEYSEEARKAKWQGPLMVYVDIDTSGNVANVNLIRKLGLGLDEKAIAAVKEWKFTPATKDGNPVAIRAAVQFNFRLL